MPLRARKHARHAAPSRTAPAVAAGGLTAAIAVADAVALGTAASAATADDFRRLRMCESGGNYQANTGNGYYGAYQFDRRTWQGLGYPGLAHQAAPGTQDAAARKLQSQRGWQPWPACSRKLGLGRSSSSSASDADTGTRAQERASRSGRSRTASAAAARQAFPRFSKPASAARTGAAKVVRVAVAPTQAPFFNGDDLTLADSERFRIGVRMWQGRMAARGWDIAVDGYFGPQSAAVAKRFAEHKDLPVSSDGTVDKAVWEAAWTLPVR